MFLALLGNLTYNRNLPNGNQYYNTSSPVIGETIENFISVNTPKIGTTGNIGIFTYNNNGGGFAGTGYIFRVPTSTGSMDQGTGYGIQLGTGADIAFTGTLATSNVSTTLTAGSLDNFNLIGNPYPSYMPANTNANAANLLTNNTSVLSEETIYLWDNTISNYVVINNASAARFIAPGQSFFVETTSGGSFNFLEVWQSHQTTDVFNKSENTNPFKIELSVSNNSVTKKTEIFYIENKTTGFDNGYDSSQFTDELALVDVYTKLASDINSQNLAIQTLPIINAQNIAIPLGLKGNGIISFTAYFNNIPNGSNVFLEDKLKNTFTKLNNNTTLNIDLENGYSGTGRFFITLNNKTLSTENENITALNIYVDANKTLHISSIKNENITFSIFDVLGKKVNSGSFNFDVSNKEFSLANLKKGVYFINLKTQNEVFSKKVLIK
ncbi:MAG: T9SS type A sorting domain-containing protein [Polaribacter sp.]